MIDLVVDDEEVVADPAGVGEPIRVAAYPDSAAAALSASIAAAQRLQACRCRVRGTGENGTTWWMVVDVSKGTLTDIAAEPIEAPAASRNPVSLARIPRHYWPVAGAAAAALIAVIVAGFVVPTSSEDAPVMTAAPTAVAVPTPPPGQLPVPAPAGWDTYAGWVVEAPRSDAAAVLVGTRALVGADSSSVFALDPESGVELWRTGTPAPVTSLFASADGSRVFAAQGTSAVAAFDAETGDSLGNAEVDASAIGLGETPFAVLPGQSGAVLIDGQWSPRQVPATTIPVGVVGTGLVNVSMSAQMLWVTTSNDPVLPPPVSLMPPADGLALTSVVAMTGDKLVTLWSDNAGGPRKVVRVEAVAADGTLSPVGSPIDLMGGYSGASVDSAHRLVGIGGLLLNVETGTGVALPQGAVTVRAGFGWSESGGLDRVRLAPDGAVESLSPSAVIPDVVLPDGRAVVRAPLGADSRGYYALVATPPTPTTTPTEPEPTPTPTNGEQQ